MSSHFETYVNNLSRLRKAKLIDRYGLEFLRRKLRRSPVASNPIFNGPYEAPPYGAALIRSRRNAKRPHAVDAEAVGKSGDQRD